MHKRSGAIRWTIAAVVFTLVAILAARSLRLVRASTIPARSISLTSAQSTAPADGVSTLTIDIHSAEPKQTSRLTFTSSDEHVATIEATNTSDAHPQATVRAGVLPGTARITASLAGKPVAHIEISTTLSTTDSAHDGMPDFLRLNDEADRDAFRRWFTYLAEYQFVARNAHSDINDCAALLRFAYRESLRRHDGEWANGVSLTGAPDAPDVRQYSYPYTALAAQIFRVHDGSFQSTDLRDGAFAEFADANTLRRFNTYLVSRDVRLARPGDLLFFRQFDQASPYHAMVFLGRSHFEPGSDLYVVYHTGPIHSRPGEVRRPSMTELMNHPDARWRPLAQNPAFLGVYRWNILRGVD